MMLKNNIYIVTLLIFAHIHLVQAYHLFHVHEFENDHCIDSIHLIHSMHLASHDHHEDFHQHDHDELHFCAEPFYVGVINKTAVRKEIQHVPQSILPNLSINSQLVFQRSIQYTTLISPADWLKEPFQGRSPPFPV
jgi:hypothetical protein